MCWDSTKRVVGMAKCDQGYICESCGQAVEAIVDSALYLQYVIGWVDPETLHTRSESHLRCVPSLAQFIDDTRFVPPVDLEGSLSKRHLDAEFVQQQSKLVSRGYARLWEIYNDDLPPPVTEYPLVEVRDKWW